MIIDMRLPVTSSRRCEQITAFGASDVPDVKISAQIESTSGSRPGSVAPACAASASASDAPSVDGGSSGVGEPGRRQDRRQPVGDRREQRLVAGLGDHEPAVRVLDVAQQVLVAAGVVEPDDRARRSAPRRRTRRGSRGCCRAAPRRGGAPPAGSRSRNSAANRHDSSKYSAWVHVRSPNLIATRSPNSLRVAPQQRRGVGRDERRLPGRGDGPRRRDLTSVSDRTTRQLRSALMSVDLDRSGRPALPLRPRPAPRALGRRVRGRARGRGRRSPGDRAEVARLPHRVARLGGATRRRRHDLGVRRHLLRPRGRRREPGRGRGRARPRRPHRVAADAEQPPGLRERRRRAARHSRPRASS